MLGKEIIIYIVSSEFMFLCFTNTKKSLVALLILLRKIYLKLEVNEICPLVLVRFAVNRLHSVSPVVNLTLIGLGGSFKSQFSVHLCSRSG